MQSNKPRSGSGRGRGRGGSVLPGALDEQRIHALAEVGGSTSSVTSSRSSSEDERMAVQQQQQAVPASMPIRSKHRIHVRRRSSTSTVAGAGGSSTTTVVPVPSTPTTVVDPHKDISKRPQQLFEVPSSLELPRGAPTRNNTTSPRHSGALQNDHQNHYQNQPPGSPTSSSPPVTPQSAVSAFAPQHQYSPSEGGRQATSHEECDTGTYAFPTDSNMEQKQPKKISQHKRSNSFGRKQFLVEVDREALGELQRLQQRRISGASAEGSSPVSVGDCTEPATPATPAAAAAGGGNSNLLPSRRKKAIKSLPTYESGPPTPATQESCPKGDSSAFRIVQMRTASMRRTNSGAGEQETHPKAGGEQSPQPPKENNDNETAQQQLLADSTRKQDDGDDGEHYQPQKEIDAAQRRKDDADFLLSIAKVRGWFRVRTVFVLLTLFAAAQLFFFWALLVKNFEEYLQRSSSAVCTATAAMVNSQINLFTSEIMGRMSVADVLVEAIMQAQNEIGMNATKFTDGSFDLTDFCSGFYGGFLALAIYYSNGTRLFYSPCAAYLASPTLSTETLPVVGKGSDSFDFTSGRYTISFTSEVNRTTSVADDGGGAMSSNFTYIYRSYIVKLLMSKEVFGWVLLGAISPAYSSATLLRGTRVLVASGDTAVVNTLNFDDTPTYSTLQPTGTASGLLSHYYSSCGGGTTHTWYTVNIVDDNVGPAVPTEFPGVSIEDAVVVMCGVICTTNASGAVNCDGSYNQIRVVISTVVDDSTGTIEAFKIVATGAAGLVVALFFVLTLGITVPINVLNHRIIAVLSGVPWQRSKFDKVLINVTRWFWIRDVRALLRQFHIMALFFTANRKYVPDFVLFRQMDLLRGDKEIERLLASLTLEDWASSAAIGGTSLQGGDGAVALGRAGNVSGVVVPGMPATAVGGGSAPFGALGDDDQEMEMIRHALVAEHTQQQQQQQLQRAQFQQQQQQQQGVFALEQNHLSGEAAVDGAGSLPVSIINRPAATTAGANGGDTSYVSDEAHGLLPVHNHSNNNPADDFLQAVGGLGGSAHHRIAAASSVLFPSTRQSTFADADDDGVLRVASKASGLGDANTDFAGDGNNVGSDEPMQRRQESEQFSFDEGGSLRPGELFTHHHHPGMLGMSSPGGAPSLSNTTHNQTYASQPAALTTPPQAATSIKGPTVFRIGGLMGLGYVESCTLMCIKVGGLEEAFEGAFDLTARQHRKIFAAIHTVVRRHQGNVYERTGERVSVSWNAFEARADHTLRAVRCARDLGNVFKEFRKEGLRLGIVVHQGPVVCGITGDNREVASVLFGQAPNFLVRLANLAAQLTFFSVLITEPVKQAVSIFFECVIVDVIRDSITGATVSVFDVRQATETKGKLQKSAGAGLNTFVVEYTTAFAQFRSHQFYDALARLTLLQVTAPNDALVSRLVRLCAFYAERQALLPRPYMRSTPQWCLYEVDAEEGISKLAANAAANTAAATAPSQFGADDPLNSHPTSASFIGDHSAAAMVRASLTRRVGGGGGTGGWPSPGAKIGSGGTTTGTTATSSSVNSRDPTSLPASQIQRQYSNITISSATSSVITAGAPAAHAGASQPPPRTSSSPIPSNISRGVSPSHGGGGGGGSAGNAFKAAVLAHVQEKRQHIADTSKPVSSFVTELRTSMQQRQQLQQQQQQQVQNGQDATSLSVSAAGSRSFNRPEGSGGAAQSESAWKSVPDGLEETFATVNVSLRMVDVQPPASGGSQEGDQEEGREQFRVLSPQSAGTVSAVTTSPPAPLKMPPTPFHVPSAGAPLPRASPATAAAFENTLIESVGWSLAPGPPPLAPPQNLTTSQQHHFTAATSSNVSDDNKNPSKSISCGSEAAGGHSSSTPSSTPSKQASQLAPPPVAQRGRAGSGQQQQTPKLQGKTSPPVLPVYITDSQGNVFVRSSRVLGTGSFGCVYMGMEQSTGRLVAMKFLPLPSAEGEVRLLQNEVATMENVMDANLVEFYGFAFVDNMIVLMMECLVAGSLSGVLSTFATLPEPTTINFMRDVLRGLHKLHSMGIVHRDVKPQNVLMAANGHCKISDFGASASIHELVRRHDGGAEVQGTPIYLAPEAARGHAEPKSDVWSVGIMYLQLTTGSIPYDGKSISGGVGAVVFGIGSGRLRPIIPKNLSPLARSFVEGCLASDVNERLTADQLLDLPLFSV
ncbi:protein kinase, putative [Bodo saltans]|uniref:Protein kinase, putative n=1 Tax=Bodo saltans TaxID=75058 RepID=A0A0S4IQC2_BODSA|nr:protein kinase, putative [Bodo saltans]|eukprot:CUF21689.1 protein kinase, putative [Bodo saltans]